MIRILTLIFMLNTFMLPVSATENTCKMMDGSSSAMMQNMTTTDKQSDMSCEMHDGVSCNSTDCVSSCAISIIPLPFSGNNSLINVANNLQAHAGFAYFYNIVLPIKTPPPLV